MKTLVRSVGAQLIRPALSLLVGLLLLTTARAAGRASEDLATVEYLRTQVGKTWAVVIGINDYDHLRRLQYAVADATEVARVLKNQGYEVIELYDKHATRRAIVSELGGKLLKRVTAKDRVLIYYAGHGVEQRVEGGRAMGYLVPVDGETDDYAGTGISMGLIKELAEALPAKHVLFVVDACYGGIAGQLFRSAEFPKYITREFLRLVTRERGRQLITAGGANQEALESAAWGHSVFTYYFLQGIGEGLADLNDDGIIPASELYTYLDNRVYAAARMQMHVQRPEFWTLAADKGEFVFVPGGATAPRQTASVGGSEDGKVRVPEKGQGDVPTVAERQETAAPYTLRAKLSPPEPTLTPQPPAGSADVQVLDRDADGCTWVQSSARTSFGEHLTKYQAQALAVSDARAKAARTFLGVKVQRSFIDFAQENNLKGQASLVERLMRMTQEGHILKEQLLSSGLRDAPGCQGCEFEVKLRSCILPLPDRSDRDFRVSLALNRNTFLNGDEGLLYISSTRDAYVYLYSIDMDQNASLLFPNEYAKDNLVKAEQQFVFPNEELRQRGIRLRARLPQGASLAAEMIRVVASKVPLPGTTIDPEAHEAGPQKDLSVSGETQGRGSFFTLLAKLHRTREQWVEDGQAFTIHEK